ncbi:MAG: fumarylacetoacetate hydrolase family protein [Bacteroidota bacterium]
MNVQLAQQIREAYTSGQCPPIRDRMATRSVVEAYAIQQINTEHWLSQGRRLIGRKIGLTSRAVQKQLGVDQPDYGMLFADCCYASGAEIDYQQLLQPRAEGEIALVLERDLLHEKHTVQDIVSATAYALPAIEIVDSRIRDWNIHIYDSIADNASSGLVALGTQPVALHQLDLELCGMVLERAGQAVATGAGIACLGNPLNAALWLADKLVELGQPLRAGDLLLTGALGPMVNIRPGDALRARFRGLGSVDIHFTPSTN